MKRRLSMAKYLVTAKIEVETISGPFPAEYQVEDMIDNLLHSDQTICSVNLPENDFACSISQVISAKVKAERL